MLPISQSWLPHALRGSLIICGVVVTLTVAPSAWAQVAPISAHTEPVQIASGLLNNLSVDRSVVFSEVVDMGPEVPWVRVLFAEADLPGDSVVRVTSLLDGEVQVLDARHLAEWRYGTAFFNGPTVRVELEAGPGTQGNSIRVEQVVVGELQDDEPVPAKAICGADDERTPSNDPAVGRMLTGTLGGGCTGTIIDCPDQSDSKCHLSAGHCFFPGVGGHQVSEVMQFDVPASNADCSLVHPPMAKQFAIDLTAAVGTNGGPGDDWSVFRTFANPMTGFTTFEEQASSYPLATTTPSAGTVRVTGFGVDTNAGATGDNNAACGLCSPAAGTGQRHQTQQTHTGNITSFAGSILRYSVDTCGGNSGGAVVQETTGRVVGIHTHGGCPTTGSNIGTAITYAPLQDAIEECAPQMLVLLDRTGSMQALRTSGNTRCEDALALAQQDVEEFFDNFPESEGSSVAVWTFADSNPSDLTGGFVSEVAALAALSLLGPDGCMGVTPLAESMCAASDELQTTFMMTPAGKILAASSDGGENNSSGECAGPASVSPPPYDPGSWQQKVRDRVLGQNVVQARFWGAVQEAIDPETGEERGPGIDDFIFFEDLAFSTGGAYQSVADDDVLPPPFFPSPTVVEIPTLGGWGLATLALLLLGAGMAAIRRRRGHGS